MEDAGLAKSNRVSYLFILVERAICSGDGE